MIWDKLYNNKRLLLFEEDVLLIIIHYTFLFETEFEGTKDSKIKYQFFVLGFYPPASIPNLLDKGIPSPFKGFTLHQGVYLGVPALWTFFQMGFVSWLVWCMDRENGPILSHPRMVP